MNDDILELDNATETLAITDGQVPEATAADDGAGDRGDDFTPTDDETPTAAVAAPAEVEAEAEAAPRGKPSMIPVSRFNEVNEDRKALAAQNQQLLDMLARHGATPATPAQAAVAEPTFDFLAAEKQYNKLLVAGEDDDAAALRMQINERIGEQAENKAVARWQHEQAQQRAQDAVQDMRTAGSLIRGEYPELDENSPSANPAAIRFVVAERDALVASGISSGQALRQAAQTVANLFQFGGNKSTVSAPAAVDQRLVQGRIRNAAAALQQAPELPGVGNRTTTAQRSNVAEMDDDEFDAIPSAEKKRMRGD